MPLNARAVATHLRALSHDVAAGGAARSAIGPARTADRLRSSTDEDEFFLLGLYACALGREPDEGGMAAHLGNLRLGADRDAVRESFVSSAEAHQALDRGDREEDVPGTERLVAHGVALVAGVAPVADALDRTVARRRGGVPLPVLVHELNPTAVPEPWQSVLARRLLDGLPASRDAGVVDRVLAKVGAYEDPEAVLALVLPGRSPLTVLRRARRARRAVQYATLELVSRSGASTAAAPAGRPAHVDLDPLVRRLAALEKAVLSTGTGPQIRIVELEGMLFGVPAEEWRLAAYLEHRGHPEPGLAALMLPRLGPGSTFVDVGANIGLYTVAAAKAVGPTGHVVSFEPTPVVAEVLRQNVQLNGLLEGGTVDVHENAVGAAPGRANLALHGSDSGHNSLFADDRASGSVPVEVVRLDDVIPVGTRVDVVKIDVEGNELAVLEGMRRVAEENPELVVYAELAEEHLLRAGTSAAGLLEAAGRLGWSHEVVHTVTGEQLAPAVAGGAPLTACLVRAARSAS